MQAINATMGELILVSGELNAAYHKASSLLGLSDAKAQILYLMSVRVVSQRDVVHLTGMSKQTVNSAVGAMVREGLIVAPSGERREALRLTPAGQKLTELKVSRMVAMENHILAMWTPEERDQLLSLNRKYLAMFEKEVQKLAAEVKL